MSARLRYPILLALLFCLISAYVCPEEYTTPFDEEELFSHLDRYEKRRYEGLRYLMNDHQKMQYLKLPTRKERDHWIERFWKLSDPTPATKKMFTCTVVLVLEIRIYILDDIPFTEQGLTQ